MSEAAAYILSRLPDHSAAVDDDRLLYGVTRARAAGFRDPAAIRFYVLLMFALEPEFDQRTRVREYFEQSAGSLDDRLLRMPQWSYPNCWYRADPDFAEGRWRALVGVAEPDEPIAWPQEGEPPPPQLRPDYGFQLDVPIIVTPAAVVTRMLELANLGPSDFVIDLGCGDGRLVIAAAERFGSRGQGVDLDREQLGRANEAARAAGVAHRVTFRRQDFLDADVTGATVVTLYLLRDLNLRLRTKLREQLRPGARAISRAFDMGDWLPDATIDMPGERIYRWTIR